MHCSNSLLKALAMFRYVPILWIMKNIYFKDCKGACPITLGVPILTYDTGMYQTLCVLYKIASV